MKQCSVEKCTEDRLLRRGYCIKHYMRWRKSGNPLVTSKEHHDFVGSTEHKTWVRIKQRCYNPNHKSFKNYGGRGIKVCERWQGQHGFLNFLQDMGNRPQGDYSIERINNDGDYSPKNCKWATRYEQSRNKRPRPNKTGFTGIVYEADRSKFHVKISVNGKVIHLGRFPSLDEAVKIRKEAESKHW